MKTEKELKTYLPAVLVFVAVLSFSLFSFYQLGKSAKLRRAKLFELYTEQAAERLDKRIIDYTQILKGCQSLFYSSGSVTTVEWKAYTKNLSLSDNYPGIQGIGYAKYITIDQIKDVELEMRKQYPKFEIKTKPDQQRLTPIIYIEPSDKRNLRALGFDMFSEVKRRQAIQRAMKTGEASITRKVTLIQETNVGVQPGFLLYLPVYKNPELKATKERHNNVEGFVYIPFRAYDLMDAVFDGFADLDIRVYDQTHLNADNLLYKTEEISESLREQQRSEIEFKTSRTLNIAGNKWTLVFSTDNKFGSQVERAQPQIVLVFGIAISILLYIVTLNYIHKRQTALEELNLTKEIERKKDEFLGIASHELKTPLTSIKAYLQMLERSQLGEKQSNFVKKANIQANKLNSLIADLLDVSKIQAGSIKINSVPFPLSELINESIESVLHLHSSHQILGPEAIPEITLLGDKLRLEQALVNLLVNAIKYSPGAGSIGISLLENNNQVTICVEDQGIGISKEHQARIFEKFYRSDDLSPFISGLGMGLFIASEIVSKHNGYITVDSNLGEGSRFCIHLPINW
ncbi:CHASE domain-containing sensor histidine kinase [Desertivirga brevis]|uniref:CHASE domain-containing sensor histidine kinase n=1 Tax=Desertivirga brevis TaxID=2810310 RepID=UPI001A963ADD|nr:CHASE domain-containing protein [Pedobacter sp. SYSU D00873]